MGQQCRFVPQRMEGSRDSRSRLEWDSASRWSLGSGISWSLASHHISSHKQWRRYSHRCISASESVSIVLAVQRKVVYWSTHGRVLSGTLDEGAFTLRRGGNDGEREKSKEEKRGTHDQYNLARVWDCFEEYRSKFLILLFFNFTAGSRTLLFSAKERRKRVSCCSYKVPSMRRTSRWSDESALA